MQSLPKWQRVLLIAVLAWAALARFSTIGRATNVDEGYFLLHGREIVRGYVPYAETQLNKAPVIAWLTAPFFLISDAPVIPARLFALATSVLGVWGVVRLARRWWGEDAALLAVVWYGFESYAALWGKMIHVSALMPVMSIWVLNLLEDGLEAREHCRRRSRDFLAAAGFLLGLAGLLKQTAVFLALVILVRLWMAFPLRQFVRHAARVAGYALLPWVPFVLIYACAGHTAVTWDDLYAVHVRMASAFDHSWDFRCREILDVMRMSPLMWLFAALGAAVGWRERTVRYVSLWLLLELLGNGFALSHLWRHYLLAILPAGVLLASYAIRWMLEPYLRPDGRLPTAIRSATLAAIALSMLLGWPNQEWGYPGISLREEAAQAKLIQRKTGDGALLNLMNPSAYLWTGQELPWSIRASHSVRVPHAYSMISRGYLTEAELKETVADWQSQDLSGAVLYGRHLRELYENSALAPLKNYLFEDLEFVYETGDRESIYAEFLVFQRRDNESV